MANKARMVQRLPMLTAFRRLALRRVPAYRPHTEDHGREILVPVRIPRLNRETAIREPLNRPGPLARAMRRIQPRAALDVSIVFGCYNAFYYLENSIRRLRVPIPFAPLDPVLGHLWEQQAKYLYLSESTIHLRPQLASLMEPPYEHAGLELVHSDLRFPGAHLLLYRLMPDSAVASVDSAPTPQ